MISHELVHHIGQWTAAYAPELLNLGEDQLRSLNDDRVDRALDRLFDASIPEMVMKITQLAVEEFQLDLSEAVECPKSWSGVMRVPVGD